MPKIREELTRAVFYLFGLGKDGETVIGPWGTGFFVIKYGESLLRETHIYAVSNCHLVCGSEGASIIRVNTCDGKSRFVHLDPSEWECRPDGDLAVADVTDRIDVQTDEVIGLFEDMFLTKEMAASLRVGIGEDTFMCGLFAAHDGGERNIPVARFGNISMMASELAPVEIPDAGTILPCHLVDTRSRGGFSGSPVFAFRTLDSDMNQMPYGLGGAVGHDPYNQRGDMGAKYFWGLLGIHCGQFREEVEVEKSKSKGKHERLGDPIKEGDTLLIEGGTTIVVPAWCILDLLEEPMFEKIREERDRERAPQSSKRARAESVTRHDSDENPTHREDFTSLLNAAAQKRERED